MARPLQTTLLFAAAAVASLGLAELALRATVEVPYRPPPPPLSPESWRALLHRPSELPGLAYELVPHADKLALGVPVRTNSLGMRDDEPRLGEDVIRVLAVGDSYTFGLGVRAEDAYPHQLEQLLNRDEPGRYDVLNLGVNGYSTRDEALVFVHKGLPLRPRAAIVGYYLNDPEIDPIQPLQRAFAPVRWWQHSTLLRRVAMAWYLRELGRYGGGDYHRYLHYQPEKWRSVVDGFQRMADAARSEGIPLLLAIFPRTPSGEGWQDYRYGDLHRRVAAAARHRGLHVVDLLGRFSQREPALLRRGENDRHPSPLGYELAAHALLEPLRERLATERRPTP